MLSWPTAEANIGMDAHCRKMNSKKKQYADVEAERPPHRQLCQKIDRQRLVGTDYYNVPTG